MDNDILMVTIHCLIYNHEPYLRQCLDGFIIQKTNFDITLLTINNPSCLMLSILASLARRHIQTEGRDLLQHQPAAEIRTYLNLVVGTLTSGRGQTTNPSGNEDYEYSEDSFG